MEECEKRHDLYVNSLVVISSLTPEPSGVCVCYYTSTVNSDDYVGMVS